MLVNLYGISVTEEAVAASMQAAVESARQIGYPVVLKAISTDIVHKSDLGGVKLDLADDEAVRTAWGDIHDTVDENLEGCLVAKMEQGGAELILGIINDPDLARWCCWVWWVGRRIDR